MNGYEILVKGYKKLIENGQIEFDEEAKSYIKVYEFLASCSQEEKKILFESSAFNDMVIKLINKLDLDVKIKKNIIAQLYNIWN